MKVAIAGVRGIPVIYSGFESLAEELSAGLVQKGMEVVVYGRKGYLKPGRHRHRGVEVQVLPSLRVKQLETILHSMLATVHAMLWEKPQVMLYLGVGSSICAPIVRLVGIKTIVHVDGLDWKREKWGYLAKRFFAWSELVALKGSDVTLTDSKYVERYYKRKYGLEIERISYGYGFAGRGGKLKSTGILQQYGLEKGKYIVWVGRLVPDNHLDMLLKTSKRIVNWPVVVVGGASYASEYEKQMRKLAQQRGGISWTGYLPREKYREVVERAGAYVETKTSGGIHPSLVEAIGMGVPVVVNDLASTKEMVGEEYEFIFRRSGVRSLEREVMKVMKLSKMERRSLVNKLRRRAIQKFSWKDKVGEYEKLITQLKE